MLSDLKNNNRKLYYTLVCGGSSLLILGVLAGLYANKDKLCCSKCKVIEKCCKCDPCKCDPCKCDTTNSCCQPTTKDDNCDCNDCECDTKVECAKDDDCDECDC